MKLSCFVCRAAGLSWVVVAVLANSANGAPGSCAKTCRPNCGSYGPHGVPCFVKVSETGGAATVQDPICVYAGTDIFWYTSEDQSEFTLIFGPQHPFANTSFGTPAKFKGKKGQPSGDTASLKADACYQYSVQHCINNGQCTPTVDPKVIVTNVRHHKGHGASENPVKK
jgi:hypothetical protein